MKRTGMTEAQRAWLGRLGSAKQGLHRPPGDNFRAFDRVMAKLCALGFARPYIHGGFEITEAGREKLDQKTVR